MVDRGALSKRIGRFPALFKIAPKAHRILTLNSKL